jgi:hypothetical protein
MNTRKEIAMVTLQEVLRAKDWSMSFKGRRRVAAERIPTVDRNGSIEVREASDAAAKETIESTCSYIHGPQWPWVTVA